jgi:hypothetical protein
MDPQALTADKLIFHDRSTFTILFTSKTHRAKNDFRQVRSNGANSGKYEEMKKWFSNLMEDTGYTPTLK